MSNPVPSQLNPLMEKLARLWLKSNSFEFNGSYQELCASRNPRAKQAIAFAISSLQELEEWTLDVAGKDLNDFIGFIED